MVVGGWRQKREGTWLWEFLQAPWPKVTLQAPLPLWALEAWLWLRVSSQVVQLSLREEGFPARTQRMAASGDLEGRCPQISLPPFVSPRCQPLALPGVPPPLCHGRLGFLGMGFAACHKSHCQGFPTDPEPCLWGRCCHCHYRGPRPRDRDGDGVAERPPPPASGLGSGA